MDNNITRIYGKSFDTRVLWLVDQQGHLYCNWVASPEELDSAALVIIKPHGILTVLKEQHGFVRRGNWLTPAQARWLVDGYRRLAVFARENNKRAYDREWEVMFALSMELWFPSSGQAPSNDVLSHSA